MKCVNCKHFRAINSSGIEGHCLVNPPIPVKWKHTSDSPTVTIVEVTQFGPTRTYGELHCDLHEPVGNDD